MLSFCLELVGKSSWLVYKMPHLFLDLELQVHFVVAMP